MVGQKNALNSSLYDGEKTMIESFLRKYLAGLDRVNNLYSLGW